MTRFIPTCFIAILIAGVSFSCNPKQIHYQVLKTPVAVSDSFGNERHYRLFLPPTNRQPIPLLAYFHGVVSSEFSRKVPALRGYTGSPIEETGLIDFCRNNRIALLVPLALYEYLFLGCRARGWVIEKELDGIERMIDAILAIYPIHRQRIFLAGISAGAGLCHYLANHRPERYAAILSHSQGYVTQTEKPVILSPERFGPAFGVLFAFPRGDYPGIKQICIESEARYREAGYRTRLLADLPPVSHRWSETSNGEFWTILNDLRSR